MTRDMRPPVPRFWGKIAVGKEDECWIWNGRINEKGYGRFDFDGVAMYAHRVAWKLSNNQEIPEGKIVMHLCDTPLRCNPKHLSIGTQAENMADMNSKGRHCKGSNKKNAKLNEQTAKEVKQLLESGASVATIATKFDVSRAAVHNIKLGKSWRHI